MREIKLRAKVKYNGQHYFAGDIVKGYYLKDHKGVSCLRINEYVDGIFCRSLYLEIEEDTLGQYTGLKDLNGKEVYEGDILLFEYDYEEYGNYITEVKFEDYAFKVFELFSTEWNHLEDMVCNGVVDGKIIGNIYENPELLEV